MAERLVDFAAAGRVSQRVELKGVRVIEVSAKCEPRTIVGPLEPTITHECSYVKQSSNALGVVCSYSFVANSSAARVAEASIKYYLDFDLQGDEPLAEEDLNEFAFANGTLHSWPFVREFLFGLTSKMGYPPYNLPVFHFKPRPQEKKEKAEKAPSTTSAEDKS